MKILLAFVLLGVALRGHAETVCPTYADVDPSSIAQSVSDIEPQMVQCADDPIATGLFGGLLLRTGRIGEALLWLEKSLLLDPRQAGVQADYALALAAQGDRFSSRAIASELLSHDAVPQTLESVLAELSESQRWQARVSGSIGTGVSNNIDFVPNLDVLDVTFGDDGSSRLPLADPTNANSAGFFQQSVRLDFLWESPEYQIVPSVRLLDRRTGGEARSDYVSALASLRWVSFEGGRIVDFSYGNVNYGDSQDRSEWALGYQMPLSVSVTEQCETGFAFDAASQSYGATPLNDARIYQFGIRGVCSSEWFWSADVGFDIATGDRVGGNRTRWSVSGGRSVPIEFGTVILSSGLSVETDEEAYSEFLDRGEPRSLTTFEFGASWQIPLSQNLIFAAEAASVRQSSNIALFDASASEISINLIYTP